MQEANSRDGPGHRMAVHFRAVRLRSPGAPGAARRIGRSAVIEWRNGEMTVFGNPIGVACNWPRLDWHLTNLRNYINLSDRNPAAITIGEVELAAMGQGPGITGLPGDASSPSRFVRAAAFVASLRPVATGEEMRKRPCKIRHNFDIPLGFVRDNDDPGNDDHNASGPRPSPTWPSCATSSAPTTTRSRSSSNLATWTFPPPGPVRPRRRTTRSRDWPRSAARRDRGRLQPAR